MYSRNTTCIESVTIIVVHLATRQWNMLFSTIFFLYFLFFCLAGFTIYVHYSAWRVISARWQKTRGHLSHDTCTHSKLRSRYFKYLFSIFNFYFFLSLFFLIDKNYLDEQLISIYIGHLWRDFYNLIGNKILKKAHLTKVLFWIYKTRIFHFSDKLLVPKIF